jgi:hypothetical protein
MGFFSFSQNFFPYTTGIFCGMRLIVDAMVEM